MVTKPGAGGRQQPYIPAGNGESSGEYTSFDQSKLDSGVKRLSNIIGYERVIEYAYESHNPPLFEGRHFNTRCQERGIKKIFVAEALLKPLEKTGTVYDKMGKPSITYFGRNATVAINPITGKLITAYPTRRNIRNKYKGVQKWFIRLIKKQKCF